MSVYGITRSRNEADIIVGSILRMLREVDHIIVGDGSDPGEGTREALEEMVADGFPLTVIDDQELNWRQREVMTGFAHMAREQGAAWVLCFDIDEVWLSPVDRIGDALALLPASAMIVLAENYTYAATALDDETETDPMRRMCWRSAAALPLPKVACRTRPDLVIGHGNHSAHYEGKAKTVRGVIRCAHFPYRSPEQFIKRVRGAWPPLRDSGLPESHGSHMWAYGRALDEGGEEALRAWFREGMWFEDPRAAGLVYDPLPA